MNKKMSLIVIALVLTQLRLVAQPKDISPDGKKGIDGSFSDLFLVDVATGKKLSPIFPSQQQGQVSNVKLVAKWSADSGALGIRASYGTRLNEILMFSVTGESAKLLKMEEPDLRHIFAGKVKDENAVGFDENVLGSWSSNDTLTVVFGFAKVYDKDTLHYLVPATIEIKNDIARIKPESPLILSDLECHSFLKDRGFQ
jgi:hypothetical protein